MTQNAVANQGTTSLSGAHEAPELIWAPRFGITPLLMTPVAHIHPSVSESLRSDYLFRFRRNPAYSLRAYARDLEVSHSHLGRVFSGKRKLSLKQGVHLCDRLEWAGEKRRGFLEAVTLSLLETGAGRSKPAAPDYLAIDLDRFKLFSEWYGLALWTFISVRGFRPEPRWVARQLGITTQEVRSTVRRLERIGLLEVKDGQWIKKCEYISIPERHASEALGQYHSQMIDKAKEALLRTEPIALETRDITGATFTADPSRIPEAKRRIAAFRKQLMQFLSQGDCREVIQLNVQMFRLAKGDPDETN